MIEKIKPLLYYKETIRSGQREVGKKELGYVGKRHRGKDTGGIQ